MSGDPVLVLDSVGRSFGTHQVLSSVYLAVPPGTITVLFGRNGTGKTTLLRVAAGLTAPDHGLITFRGERTERPRLHRWARRGLLFLPDRSVYSRGLGLGAQLRGAARRWGSGRLESVAEALDLGPFLSRRPGALSGGEVRRANLALALLLRPVCLLADEPLRSAAPLDQELLARELRGLAAAGAAVVVSGHETGSLLDLADRVAWVTSGTCYTLGTPEEALAHEAFRRDYIWEPGSGRPPPPASDAENPGSTQRR